MFGNRRKALLLSAAVLGGAMLTTACQNSDSGAAQGSSSNTSAGQAAAPAGSSSTGGNKGANQGGNKGANPVSNEGSGKDSAGKSSTGNSSGGQGAAAGSGSGSDSGNGKNAKCRTDELKITAMDSTISGDTEGTVAVTLKNTGSRTCAISGYAGVDLKTNAGTLSAERNGRPVVQGTLKSGESVSFGIFYPVNDTGGSGVRITGLVVTPPDETKSVTLPWPGGGSLPVTESGGTPVKVGPIGSAGQGG
ncbi:MAG: DUF4232 domain-containing protein [Streptomycetaceae bacterium]|nr:DUF4232 domain-containing protein [Streptomycetaceae bacterium]